MWEFTPSQARVREFRRAWLKIISASEEPRRVKLVGGPLDGLDAKIPADVANGYATGFVATIDSPHGLVTAMYELRSDLGDVLEWRGYETPVRKEDPK